jgi:hypothetical protein
MKNVEIYTPAFFKYNAFSVGDVLPIYFLHIKKRKFSPRLTGKWPNSPPSAHVTINFTYSAQQQLKKPSGAALLSSWSPLLSTWSIPFKVRPTFMVEIQSLALLALVVHWLARPHPRVSVQGVKSLGGHFACLCRWFDF